ncbi:MAG: hypothetical protein PHY14_04735 [Candidatus Gracilibacteria bacterium]|nr:hypothetical protein [Candidatus Gracilibacteria bacterium]
MSSTASTNSGNISPSGPNTPKKNTGKNIESLFQEATRDRYGKFDHTIYNAIDAGGSRREKAIQQIRDAMEAKYDIAEYEFNMVDISELSSSNILAYFAKYSRNLQSLRKNTPTIIGRTFVLSDEISRQILEDLDQYSEKELSDIIETPASIKRYLIQQIGLSRENIELWTPKLDYLFPSEAFSGNPQLLDKVTKAIISFKNNHVPFDRGLIYELIQYFGSNSDKMKRIAEEFHITITIKNAIGYGILSYEKVDMAVKEEYKDIWNELSEKQQKDLQLLIRTDDSTQFSIDELSKKFSISLDPLFENKDFQRELLRTIKTQFTEYQDNPDRDTLTTTFTEFLEKIENKKLKIQMHPLDQARQGAILVCRDRIGGRMRFIKIEKIDQELPPANGFAGLTLSFLDGTEDGTIGRPKGESTLSYDLFEKKLETMDEIQVMSEDDLFTQVKNGFFIDDLGRQITDVSDKEKKENEIGTLENLKYELDKIDPEGVNIPIAPGMTFIAKGDSIDGKKKGAQFTFKINTIDEINKEIILSNGEKSTFRDFLETIKSGIDFHRIYILNSNDDFIKALSAFGVKSSAKIDDHELKVEDEIEEDDGHGHKHKKKKEVSYEYFTTDDEKTHIRLKGIGDEFVTIWEYNPGSDVTLEKILEAKRNRKLSKSQEKGQYVLRTMTREDFLVYLKENKLKATTKDLLDPHAGYHPHDQHMHTEMFGLFKGLSINDISKGFSNIIHGFEHYFEKNSKLNASRFALRMGRKFGFPADIMAQLQADEVASMKEVIEKIQDKLYNLNGPVARNKALHIAQLSSSSPEEVGAAMIYMVKSYGHLYAEDIAHAQGSESFLNGFLYSLGWRGEDATIMKRDARAKFLADLGSGSDGGEPTEEEILWGLFKIIDGKAGRKPGEKGYDPRFANAGAVVKAMGGPSGWEKAWRTEGIKNAYDKGIRQGGAVVNAEGRVNKGLSAFKTFELNTAMGFMEKAAGKTPDPSVQTVAVIWALGGYSGYCSTEMKQKVKGYGDSQGHTFHAYAFLRNQEDNDIYTKVFVQALRDINPTDADKAQNAINIIRQGPKNDKSETKEAYEKAIDELGRIWKDNYNSGLHSHLQGKSPWIVKEMNKGNEHVERYAKRFAAIHLMNSSETHPSDDNAWWLQYGYNSSGIFGDNKGNATKEQDGKKVLSLDGTLNKLRIDGYEFQKDAHDRLWPVVVGQFSTLKEEPDEELRKAQYKQYRADLINHFRRMRISAGGIEAAVSEVKRREYYKDIVNMGLDPYDFFVHTPIELKAEENYQSWLRHTSSGGTQTESVMDWAKQTTQKNLGKRK